MNNETSNELLNSSILNSLEFLKLNESRNENNYYYGDLPNNLSLNEYKIVNDTVYTDSHQVDFISENFGKTASIKINISDVSGLYAIKELNKTLFTKLDDFIDIDLITQFYLIKTNVVDRIDPDFFQPLKHGLKGVFFAESFLPTIPSGLFRDLELETLSIMSNTISQTVPDFGLNKIASITQGLTFVGNSISNIDELKLSESIAQLKINKKIVKY